MTPLEKELYMRALQRKTGTNAAIGNALELGGTALTYVDDAVTPAATKLQNAIVNGLTKVDPGASMVNIKGTQWGDIVSNKAKVLNMAASPKALQALKVATGIGAVGGVLGAADVVAGNDSVGNKLMDSAAMGIGGFLGAAGGPVGIAAGAGTGKMVSDSLQWLFGDKKTAEQRKMEEALAQLGV